MVDNRDCVMETQKDLLHCAAILSRAMRKVSEHLKSFQDSAFCKYRDIEYLGVKMNTVGKSTLSQSLLPLLLQDTPSTLCADSHNIPRITGETPQRRSLPGPRWADTHQRHDVYFHRRDHILQKLS